MPAMVVLLPEFDLLYVPMTALAVGWWWQALHTGRKRYAVGAALAISVCCLFAFNVLIMGTCFLAITFLARTSLRAIVVQLAVALGTAALFYLLLYLATGYNLIATFLAAWHQHEIVRREVYRPWPATILNDPINFVIALGWLPVIVLVSYFLRADRAKLALVLVCLAQPMLVAVTGLLQTESHRLWLVMMPLLIVPVGLDLARWPREHRVALYGCQTIVLIFVTESLRFH